MSYILSMAKALTLVATLHAADGSPEPMRVGDEALCPDQTEGYSDEEYECRVVALSPEAGIVILQRNYWVK